MSSENIPIEPQFELCKRWDEQLYRKLIVGLNS